MSQKLTDTLVKSFPSPESGNKIYYDSEVKGFGFRVTKAGARAFILNYRNRHGRERRYTIGSYPDWKVAAAREEAKELKRKIDVGGDPMAETEADRTAKTVADMCERFKDEHLPKKRPATARDYRTMIDKHILPAMRHMKVATVSYSDIDDLHRKITKQGRPYVANRMVSVLSKMFSLAINWKWRPDNPCKGIERNQEDSRERYLTAEELQRLTTALADLEDQQAANIIRMLLLTGARKGEVLSATWDQFDLSAGAWTKPSSHTKQKKTHRVPLSAPARQLLADIHKDAKSDFVFPGRFNRGHREEIKSQWRQLCKTAEIEDLRLHDLRHSYASMLASAGLSLPVIGALLGHTQPATTARYTHLVDDPLRQATERVGAVVMPSKKEDAQNVAYIGTERS